MADEQPLRFFREVGETMAEVATELDELATREHVESMHVPPPRRDALQAVPFPRDRIPDVVVAQMIEFMETENCDERVVALRFGRPLSLVLREMADYRARFQRFVAARARGY